ncbi:hypothetical protein [Winogradskyella alexanderae]|uniref:DUF2178 domain-containing protein n=1 Tax=Winogradskyella alexanderae TaxID=2877123 RepID=A0ABS7XV26_9FLAO|nr:hypothetical protein [Winogradskyella alexanderae]MCA0133880.1 hypothetical protein [Winogradskyella alexanderae]
MNSKNKTLYSFIPFLGIITLISFWVFKATKPFNTETYFVLGLVILIIGISLYFKITSYKSEKAGLTAEDEFSKRVKEKSAAKAFNWSIYMWLFIIFLVDMEPRNKITIGLGIIGMGLIFFLNWLYLSKVGISDENKD